MTVLKRTDATNVDFRKLVKELDISLGIYYKEETSFYEVLNTIDDIKHAVVAYDDDDNLIGCGGIKAFSKSQVEIKRMYVVPTFRGKGIATLILHELEKWSTELNFEKCILETLKEKAYAINFYKKNNYNVMPNFGEYAKAENSVCFEKAIK